MRMASVNERKRVKYWLVLLEEVIQGKNLKRKSVLKGKRGINVKQNL